MFKNKHFLSLVGNGMMAVFSVLSYSLLYRFLSEHDMGNWIFFQFAFILLDTFRTGLLQTALIKFYSGSDASRRATVAGSSWYIGMLLTGCFVLLNMLVFYTSGWVLDEGVSLLIKWFGISFLLTLPFNVSLWILQAEQRFDQILYIRIINQGSFLLFACALYIFETMTMQGVMYTFLASSFLTSSVCLATGWARLGTLRHKTTACAKEIYHFGKYSVGTFLCSNLLKSSDTFIIKFMLGPAALAVYNLPQRLMEIIEIPLRSILYTAMPDMSAAINQNKKQEVVTIMKRYSGLLTLLFIPITLGVVLLADVLVLLIGGQKYLDSEAANVLRIFMVFSLLFPVERFLGVTLDIINKPHLNLIKVVLALGVNVVADLIGIKLLGNVYGVAISSIFTFTTSLLYGYFALNRFIPLSFAGFLHLAFAELKSYALLFSRKINLLKT
ncbi:oligosaccharide flippase family protein [Pontibacter sp. E15-1]|uniref:lipopolysaccharide biosynthesis protein n=1 Tax=Pontibacter sp. E15-1 TaxID=2919918 RepID=UPI001F4FAEA7|nr:oligosaccharide flippase family protein [Pontibacter sp. E15-1]MCJ8163623.1 oligosaccharide flippase family protein [Pontibacter sp. E15-1]